MLFYAEVTNRDDPLEMRRVKVRVATVHGPGFPDHALPWADTRKFGGSPDTGGYPVLLKGSGVHIAFENGDFTRPVVLCAATKKYDLSQKYGDSQWSPIGEGNDVPAFARDPNIHLVYLSSNGDALYSDQTPGSEKQILVDRAGQYFEMAAPLASAEVGALRREGSLGESAVMEALLTGDAFVKTVDISGNKIETKTTTDGKSTIEFDNPRNGNFFKFDENGLVLKVLGGEGEGGLTLIMDSAGLRLNGQELATETVVDWLNAHQGAFTHARKVGESEPFFPPAATELNAKKEASIDSSGMKTKLV